MASRDANVEKSMDEILAQVQREYADEGREAAQTAPGKQSAEIVNIKVAGDSPAAQSSTRGDVPDGSRSEGFAALAQLAEVYKVRRRASEFPMGGTARTLEDVMRDMLQPMLQGWLDVKLPGIVERLVTAELSRVIGDAISV